MGVVEMVAMTMGAAWASGINLYAAVTTLGLLGAIGWLDLPTRWDILEHPLVIATGGLMFLVEFVADKIPGADSLWDAIHTFIRIPAAAVLAYSAFSDVDPALGLAAGLAGGSLATANHSAKAGLRLAINTSPEPFTNAVASVAEDGMVISGLLLAATHPALFLTLLALWLVLLAWLLPRVWRFVRQAYGRLRDGLKDRRWRGS